MQHVLRLFDRIDDTHVIIDQEHDAYVVEGVMSGPKGAHFTAKAEGRDLRATIDGMAKKMEAQLRQWKDWLVDHHPNHGHPSVSPRS